MSDPQPASPASRLAEVRRGVGEIIAFIATCVWAFVQFCLGIWPEWPRKPPPPGPAAHHPVKDLAKKLGPYPTQD